MMEINLNYNLMLSLKEITLRKVAVILWTQTDIRIILSSLSYQDYCYIKYKVKDNIKKLNLPTMLTEQVVYLGLHVVTEIFNWRVFHERYLKMFDSFDLHMLQLLFWTADGTIDYKKSALNLIQNEKFDTVKNYRLACLYCLEDHIPILWQQFSEENKKQFYELETEELFICSIPNLEFSWPHFFEGKETKFINMLERILRDETNYYQYTLDASILKGNKAAIEYFLRKITETEKKDSFVISEILLMKRIQCCGKQADFPITKISDTFCYLLPLMSVDEQITIFRKFPRAFLVCFLDWPRQNRFLDVAKFIWNFLSTFDYVDLLKDISSRIESDSYFSKLFQKFFMLGSDDFKEYFVNREIQSASCFRDFFNVRDSETIKLIFRNVDSVHRKKLAFSKSIFQLFDEDIQEGDWDLVELCLKEAKLSTEDNETLKDALSRCAKEIQEREKKFYAMNEGESTMLSTKNKEIFKGTYSLF